MCVCVCVQVDRWVGEWLCIAAVAFFFFLFLVDGAAVSVGVVVGGAKPR